MLNQQYLFQTEKVFEEFHGQTNKYFNY